MTDALTALLRDRLRDAMVARDRPLVSAFRTALATLANAEAVPSGQPSSTDGDHHFAGSASGLGAAEADRRVLTAAERHDLIAGEVEELRHAAETRAAAGLANEADDLRRAADALQQAIATV